MFKVLNDNIKFPELYPSVERKLDTVNEKGWDRVGSHTLRDKIDFMPQQGLQENFCRCESNLIFMTGSMGMGKTFSFNLRQLYGIDLPGYSGVMISVRLQDSSKGSSIFRDANEVFGSFAGCDVITSGYPTFAWPQWNSSVRLIHSNFNAELPSEWEMFKDYAKKVQASYIAIDEATQIKSFKMFTYWFGRNRDSSGLTPTMALSFNPDHDHWTTQMLRDAGCLTDDWYLRKDMNGVTKYFYVKGETPESIIWGNTPEEVIERAGITLTKRDIAAGATAKDMVKSFTMFTGETADNRKLMSATKGGMLGNLHAMGGVQRDINKGAYFGPVEKDELSVNRTMIHSLWENPISEDQNMYATLDVSGGNTDSDNCPMCIFKGNSLVAIDMFHGSPKELVTWIECNLNKYNIPVSNFAFDATGIGNYLRAFTSGVPLTANRRPIQELDAQGNPINLDVYFNLRSQLLSRLEVMFQKGELNFSIPKDMTIPYGKKGEYRKVIDILFDEMNVLSFTTRNNKRYARSKEEYKNKYKCSPDLLDSIMLFMFFFLDAKPKKQPKPMVEEDAYDEIFAPHPLVGWGYY